jgi:hypothetical protein
LQELGDVYEYIKNTGGGSVTWDSIYNFLSDPDYFDNTDPITIDVSGKKIVIGLDANKLADFINTHNLFVGAVTYDNTTHQFTFTGGGGGGISDAPSDSKIYGRKDGIWVEIQTGGGGTGNTDWSDLNDHVKAGYGININDDPLIPDTIVINARPSKAYNIDYLLTKNPAIYSETLLLDGNVEAILHNNVFTVEVTGWTQSALVSGSLPEAALLNLDFNALINATDILSKNEGVRTVLRIKNLGTEDLNVDTVCSTPSNNKFIPVDTLQYIPANHTADYELYVGKESDGTVVKCTFLNSYDSDTGQLYSFTGYSAIANIERVIANALSRHEVQINP